MALLTDSSLRALREEVELCPPAVEFVDTHTYVSLYLSL